MSAFIHKLFLALVFVDVTVVVVVAIFDDVVVVVVVVVVAARVVVVVFGNFVWLRRLMF